MDTKQLAGLITGAVKEYLASEESYDDNAQLRIDPATLAVDIADCEEADDDADPRDYYDIMDFVTMTPQGDWVIDSEAIDSTAAEYTA